MRCCGKLEATLLALALLFAVGVTRASDIVAETARLVADGDGYSLNADFQINLGRSLEEAVNKGVALYFTADFELTRSRWYWFFDQTVAQRSRTFRLSYHALTRQYRLSSGALHQSFHTLADALRVLSRLRHWQVVERDDLDEDVDYLASARLRLDPSQMPKTFQVSALSNPDWSQSSEWLRWNFSVEAAPETAGENENTEKNENAIEIEDAEGNGDAGENGDVQ
ncbi:MAG: DUF4390 domain-containing protein [Candidatus Accumulibacter sp.]|nr:DUF4390 domain-containing protein [Accumulibacter sp.]